MSAPAGQETDHGEVLFERFVAFKIPRRCPVLDALPLIRNGKSTARN